MYDTLHAPATGTGPAQEFLGSRELTPTPNPRLESVMYLSVALGTILKEKQPCGVNIHVAGNAHNPTCVLQFIILVVMSRTYSYEVIFFDPLYFLSSQSCFPSDS